MAKMQNKQLFMKKALELAKKYKGLTHPNPTVGAVIVKNGKIIGKGAHKKAGYPHAEREAIKNAIEKGYDIANSEMYITLEPCCHYGKTPPCTEAIIDNKIKKVFIATLDPNPLVAGKGVEILKNQGIEVETGLLQEEAQNLNEDFFYFIKKQKPFIHIKFAQTLDGKIATSTGSSKWITGEEARKYAHLLRKEAGAVLVGSKTALKDNPSLTVRYIETERQPKRILIDKYLETPINYNIFNEEAETFVITSEKADKSKIEVLQKKPNVKVFILPLRNKYFNWNDILDKLKEEGIIHILVEGGKGIITSLIKQDVYQRISTFIAPKLIGEDGISSIGQLGIKDINQSINLKISNIQKLGQDILLQLKK